MSRLTRDGTAEPVSRDQILRHARDKGMFIFPVQLTTSRIGNLTRLIHTLLYVITIHTYIHTLTTSCFFDLYVYSTVLYCTAVTGATPLAAKKCEIVVIRGYRMARGWRYTKLSLSGALFLILVYFFGMCILSTCPLHTNSGCGKERRILIGPW